MKSSAQEELKEAEQLLQGWLDGKDMSGDTSAFLLGGDKWYPYQVDGVPACRCGDPTCTDYKDMS